MSQVQRQHPSRSNNSLSLNGECGKGELKDIEVKHNYSFHTDGERRIKNNGKQVITLQLLDTGSSAGALNQQQYQVQGSNDERREDGIIGNNDLSSVLTAPADDRGVKVDSPPRANNCHLTRQSDAVVNRRGRARGRRERYDNYPRSLLYTCWQGIRLRLSPITEQEEYSSDKPTELSISEVANSHQRLVTLPSLSSPDILSDCSAKRKNKAAFSDADSKHSNPSCMVTSCIKTEQRNVPDTQAIVGEQPSCTTSCSEHEEHLSCNNNVCQMPICDPQAIQNLESSAFPDISRKSSVAMDKESDRMFTEASMSPFLSDPTTNSQSRVSRPKYSCLRRHKKYTSNKQSKRRSPQKRYSKPQTYCTINSKVQQYYRRAKAELKKSSESMHRYGRTCMEAINCIACVSR